jgi:hypothetical protein
MFVVWKRSHAAPLASDEHPIFNTRFRRLVPLLGVVDETRSNFTAETPRTQRKISSVLRLGGGKAKLSNSTQRGDGPGGTVATTR